ncbi:hypothetical protein ACH5RR_000420 [Cinchona calisaya]|uniref:Uncharacterized protein n=1 Tax=Cinchona calisaya TaxID=153742 RepID=A0ABD3B0S1_9GENT
MASTVPAAKSQPLHNFSLSHLKWKSNHQRPRSSSTGASRVSSSSSPHRSPTFGHDSPHRQAIYSPLRGGDSASAAAASPSHHSPMRGEDSAPPMQVRQSPTRSGVGDYPMHPTAQPSQSPNRGKSETSHKNSKPLIEYRRQSRNSASCSGKTGISISSPDRDFVEEKSEKKLKAVESDNKDSRSSKILIKFRQKGSKIADEVQVEEEEGKIEEDNEAQEDEGKLLGAFVEDDEQLPKTWNLRPRRPIRPSLNLNAIGFKNNGSTVQEKRFQSPQVNHNANHSRSENQKKEKRKIGFTLTLSREEIEEDMYALIGSKPSRRPKKRPKNVQKIIDNICPGAWLQSITADSYKVSEHPGKG